jgi:hypothetical protein
MTEGGPRFAASRLTENVVFNARIGSQGYEFRRRPADDSGQLKVSVLHCQCAGNHEDSKGAFGCGASWLIGATFDAGNPGRGARLSAVNAKDAAALWPVAGAYLSTVSSSLSTVKTSAGKWQTGLTSILGIVTVVSLIGGRTTLQAISTGWRAAIVALAGIAFAANAWGIYKSTLSSIGFPAISRVKDAIDLRNSDLWPLRQTIHAADNLRAAVGWSAVAFIAGIGAVGLVWLSPNTPAPSAKVDLTVLQPAPSLHPTATVTVTACGILPSPQPTGSPPSIAFVPSPSASPAPTVTYPMTSVVGIAPGNC